MNYSEALEIAKAKPGWIVQRGSNGQFEVRDPRDRIAVSNAPTELTKSNDKKFSSLKEKIAALEEQNMILSDQIKNKDKKIKSIKSEKQDEVAALNATIQHLEQACKSQNLPAEGLHRLTDYQIQKRADRETANQNGITQANQKRNLRKKTWCTCNGENENCYRCLGTGQYFTDGYGRVVPE